MTVGLNIASARWGGQEVQLVDLPGTYALDPVSDDQWVARHGLLDWKPDVVIAVVDATNLARNLYLVLQIIDLGPRVVIALNLIDEARRQSLRIDPRALSQALGLPVVPTVARRGEGLDELTAAAAAVASGNDGLGRGRAVRYSARVEAQVAGLEAQFADVDQALPEGLPPRAAALALLEGDEELVTAFGDAGKAAAGAGGTPLAVPIAAARHAAATAIAGHRCADPAGRAGLGVRLSVLRRRLAVRPADLAVDGHGVAAAGLGRPRRVRLRRPGRHAALGPRRRHPGGAGRRHPLHPHLLLRARPARRLGLHERGRVSGRSRHAPLRPARPRRHSADGRRRLQRAGHHGDSRAGHQARAHDRLHAGRAGALQCPHRRDPGLGLAVRRLAVGVSWRPRPGSASALFSGRRRRSCCSAASPWAPCTRPASSGI